MVRTATEEIQSMGSNGKKPPMALGKRTMQRVRGSGTSATSERQTDLRPMVLGNSDSMVPNRIHAGETTRLPQAQRKLHIALVVADLKVFGELKRSAYVIGAHDNTDPVVLHVIFQRKDQPKEELLYRWALTELGLCEPKITGLQYPEEIQLGWDDESARARFDT